MIDTSTLKFEVQLNRLDNSQMALYALPGAKGEEK